MSRTGYTVILVHSTNHALRAEKALKDAGVSCKLIPVPRRFSSDCGVCVRVPRTEREAALDVVKASRTEIEAVHEL